MSDPFKITGPTCISFSGGRTSAYMLWRVLQAHDMSLPEDAVVCFANTGKEDEATLRFVRDCEQQWKIEINWLEYTAPKGFKKVGFDSAARDGEPFAELIQKKKYLPNPVARFCTEELKVKTINRFLEWMQVEADTMVGVRADEPRRVAKFRANPKPEGKHEEVWLPLAASNVSSADVGRFWRSQPFDLELPNINGKTMHGNCDLCYLKPASQVLSLIAERPERAIWWAAQEGKAESVAASAARFRDDRPSYAEMLKFSQEQRDMFDANEEGIACFCGD